MSTVGIEAVLKSEKEHVSLQRSARGVTGLSVKLLGLDGFALLCPNLEAVILQTLNVSNRPRLPLTNSEHGADS